MYRNNVYNLPNSRNNSFLNKNKKFKPSESLFILNNNMFPELQSKGNQEDNNVNIKKNLIKIEKDNFSNLLKKKMLELEEINNSTIENEKKGWITIKKGIPYIPNKEKIEKEEEPVVEPYIVFKKLTKVYENWKKNYIEQWGYDEYEKNYRFPNYDYSYLESEEEEMEAMDF